MQLIGLGQAFELQLMRFGRKRLEILSFPAYWWAWDGGPTTGDIRLVKIMQRGGVRLTARTVAAATKFHDKKPVGVLVDAPPLIEPLVVVGRAVAIGYDARGHSNSKDDAPYRHHFGAVTHHDTPPFDDRYWPDVCLDRARNLVIKRRSTNTYELDDWLIG